MFFCMALLALENLNLLISWPWKVVTKEGEEQDDSDKVPNKDDTGIEMEQDFATDTFSVSEDSGGEDDDDDKDGEDEQLEFTMGETGADNEVIDEKLWNKEEEEDPNTEKEKYESRPSVKDGDQSSSELRAKEDSAMGNMKTLILMKMMDKKMITETG